MGVLASIIKDRRTPYAALAAIFVLALYLRTEAYLYAPDLPFGMGDAAFHYQIQERIYNGKDTDHIPNGLLYSEFQGRFFFPPFSYYLPAYVAKAVGDFQHSVYLVNGLFNCLAVLSTFLLAMELFGAYPALASALFVALSIRDVSSLLWGQWPLTYSLPFISLALYAGLKSLRSPKYIYLLSASLGLCALTYPQIAIFSLSSFGGFLLLIRPKRMPYAPRHVLISVAIFLLLVLPLLMRWSDLEGKVASEGPSKLGLLSTAFSWYPVDYLGIYPPKWYSSTYNYGIFGIALALLGVGLLYLRREDKTAKAALALFASMAGSLYLATHVTQSFISLPRALKFIPAETYALAIVVAAPFSKRLTKDTRIRTLAFILLLLFAADNLPTMAGAGERIFPVGVRITPGQMEAAAWLKENTGDEAAAVYYGFDEPYIDWGTVLSGRRILEPEGDRFFFQKTEVPLKGEVYAILDGNIPQAEGSIRAGYVRQLEAADRLLSDRSVIVFSNGEVTIRRLT
ncbi:MAG: glycosyltransferase family 39 protein [Candidatus Altiarchaeota archaeon]